MKQQSTTATIERVFVETGLTYEDAIKALEGAIGKLDIKAAADLVRRRADWLEVEATMAGLAGPAGLMVFATFDQGLIASLDGAPLRCRVYIVGNPAIAAKIVRVDPRASLYVPFRVAIHESEGAGRATISFDRPSSFLGALDNPALAEFGQLLDDKIDAVVTALGEADRR